MRKFLPLFNGKLFEICDKLTKQALALLSTYLCKSGFSWYLVLRQIGRYIRNKNHINKSLAKFFRVITIRKASKFLLLCCVLLIVTAVFVHCFFVVFNNLALFLRVKKLGNRCCERFFVTEEKRLTCESD